MPSTPSLRFDLIVDCTTHDILCIDVNYFPSFRDVKVCFIIVSHLSLLFPLRGLNWFCICLTLIWCTLMHATSNTIIHRISHLHWRGTLYLLLPMDKTGEITTQLPSHYCLLKEDWVHIWWLSSYPMYYLTPLDPSKVMWHHLYSEMMPHHLLLLLLFVSLG